MKFLAMRLVMQLIGQLKKYLTNFVLYTFNNVYNILQNYFCLVMPCVVHLNYKLFYISNLIWVITTFFFSREGNSILWENVNTKGK